MATGKWTHFDTPSERPEFESAVGSLRLYGGALCMRIGTARCLKLTRLIE
jgi:hypothetical protein